LICRTVLDMLIPPFFDRDSGPIRSRVLLRF
jgi:hypothetical protein